VREEVVLTVAATAPGGRPDYAVPGRCGG